MSRATPSTRLPLALLAALSPISVAAFDFTLGESNDMLGKWNTTVSIAAGWRVQDRNPALYSPANGNLQGLPTGTGGNADDGNLNYAKGVNFLTVAALTSTLELSRGAYGGLVTISAWYDYTLNKRGVPHGNEANNYVAGQPLGDQNFPTLARFDGITALAMYAYGSWDLGDSRLSARLGRQVVKWGKSLVLQGVDQINPIEINTLRRPGTRLEEALIPVGMLYSDLTLATGTRIEAFYQFEWKATVLEPCGTYFSSIDASRCVPCCTRPRSLCERADR